MLMKSEADRASAQAVKARRDAGDAGTSAAAGARNLGAAVLATLAEVTAPEDDRKGKRHAQRARAKAVKAARRDREEAGKAATKAAAHGRKAAEHSRAAAEKRTAKAKGKSRGAVSTLADVAGAKAVGAASTAAGTARLARSQMADKVSSSDVTGKARAKAARARDTAASVRESAVHAAAERSGPLADSARERAAAGAAVLAALAAAARERADETRTRSRLGVDHGVAVAMPHEQDGVAVVGVRADQLRDVINEELLPRIQEMIADLQTTRDGRTAKDGGAAAMDAKPRKKKRRKGGVLIALGLLTAAGAGVAWYLDRQQRQGERDPWASSPGAADPWASRTPTSAGEASVGASVGASAATTTMTPAAPATPATSTTGVTGTGTDVSGDAPRMLEPQEIDDLASDTPSTAEEQTPGESPTEEIQTARQEAGPAVTDTAAGEVDEGADPGRATRG